MRQFSNRNYEDEMKKLSEVTTSYDLRMRVADKPGVLADVTRILADASISIDAMLQKEAGEGETQTDLIILTHETKEKHADAAIATIESLSTVAGKVSRIRLEHLG
jgi:homoserine dehydrogenase